MSQPVEFSIVTESYNLGEGAQLESLRTALGYAVSAARAGSGEVLLADVDGRPEIEGLLKDFPTVRRIPCAGLSYDAAKNRAVQSAQGEYVAFLDGDCVPNEGWVDALLEPLRSRHALSSCGFTSYAGGLWASLQTILDFGFLLPRVSRFVGCYPCNNWAAVRSDLLAHPIPDRDLRCSCFLHAQEMQRRGTPIWMAAEARVRHDLPPFFAERLRRGWDLVAVCWEDPTLPEADLLRLGLAAVFPFYARNIAQDWKRLRRGRRDLGLSRSQRAVLLALVPLLRTVDAVGIARALRRGALVCS